MLLVQKFLEIKSFGDLAKEHGVYASFSKSGKKWSLNYDQIESKDDDLLSQECRGLILSSEDGKSFLSQAIEINGKLSFDHICPGKTKILNFPMKRFFNYGQGACANIDWNDVDLSVESKMDGSLINLYFDPFLNFWCVATRSVPEADLLMDNGTYSFRLLFEKVLKETYNFSFKELTDKLNINCTYCFELTTIYNRIVVNYITNKITLLSIRDINTLQELKIDDLIVNSIGIPTVQKYSFTTIEELITLVSTFSPLEHEGVVVKDSNFNRVKIKNINYVMYNRARDVICNDRAFITLILNEKEDDFMEFLPPEFKARTIELSHKLGKFKIQLMEDFYDCLNNSSSKKEFALLIQQKKIWGAPLFSMFDKKCIDFKDYINQNKSKIDSSFSHSFLDKLLDLLK